MHLVQRPCYQRGRQCQDPAGNWTTRRPPDHGKEMQAEVIWTYLPFIRSGPNHLARHSERGKRTRQTEEEVGRQHQGMDRPEFAKSQRAVKNREKWRKLTAIHLCCLNDPWSYGKGEGESSVLYGCILSVAATGLLFFPTLYPVSPSSSSSQALRENSSVSVFNVVMSL